MKWIKPILIYAIKYGSMRKLHPPLHQEIIYQPIGTITRIMGPKEIKVKEDEAIHLIRCAHDMGCNFFDTAERYAFGENEKLLGEAIKPIRNQVIIATKFGGPRIVGNH